MECKFIKHGIAISYNGVIKPCCDWIYNQSYAEHNHYSGIDLVSWHKSTPIVNAQQTLAEGKWPASCQLCSRLEQTGRYDSMRGNGNSAYAHYQDEDITLEIRPGSVCNFACQTCWPEASSRVAQFHDRAKLIDIKNLNSTNIDNFDFLLPIASKIKNVNLLGGEPFYDKHCLKFLKWAQQHLSADITMFTNGSTVDWDWVDNYNGIVTLVFSIDAVSRPAEYIRYGTEWPVVENNFRLAMAHPKINVRVNITTSVYNYYYISDVFDLLTPKWPDRVTFGTTRQTHFRESVIPVKHRPAIIERLARAIFKIQASNIEPGQKSNAVNALKSIIINLRTQPWDKREYQVLQNFVAKMDSVKKINAVDYVKFFSEMLDE